MHSCTTPVKQQSNTDSTVIKAYQKSTNINSHTVHCDITLQIS